MTTERAIGTARTMPSIRSLALLLFVTLACLIGGVSMRAQAGDEPTAKTKEQIKLETEAHARKFDFWVGHWDVLSSDGTRQGENLIEKTQGGWFIEENWTGASGSTGKSVNFYDAERGAWRQVWMGATGALIEYQGSFRDGAMRFDGRFVLPNGDVRKQRSSFTPMADGRVHQFIENSEDGGATWKVWFDGYYQRKGEPAKQAP